MAPLNRNIIFLWKISDAHSGKQARYTLGGRDFCHVSANVSEHPAVSIFYSEGCIPIHHFIQYDNRK